MKILRAEALPKLPAEVKALVADGVYSLYELDTSDAPYLLYTQRQIAHYFLDRDGGVVRSGSGTATEQVKIRQAVSFAAGGTGVRLNFRFAV